MSAAAEIHRDFPDINADQWPMTIIPLAGNATFSNSGGSMGRVLNAESKFIPEGLAYFNFLARPEILQYLYDNGTAPNHAHKSVVTRPNPQFDTLMASAGGVSGPDFTTRSPFYSADPIGRAFTELWIGERTPLDTIQQVDRDRAIMFAAVS